MANEDQTDVNLNIKAHDETGPALRSIAENLEKTKRTFETLGSGLVFGKAFTDFANLERSMERLQFSTSATDKQMRGFKEAFEDIARSNGIAVEQLTRQFSTYLDLSGQVAGPAVIKQFQELAEVQKVTGLSFENLGRVAASAASQMQIPQEEVGSLLKKWSVEIPTTMLDTFSRAAPRLMQMMQSVGLTGEKNAEQIGLMFSELSKATGSPRVAMMGLNNLFGSMNDSASKLGKLMGPTLDDISEHGGTALDQLKAVDHTLRDMGAFDPKNRRYLNEMFGIDFNTMKTIDTLTKHIPDMEAGMKRGLTANQAYAEVLKKFAGDSQSALDDLKASVEGLGESLASLGSNLGANKVLKGLADLATQASGAAHFVNDAVGYTTRAATGTKTEEDQKNGPFHFGTPEDVRKRQAILGFSAGAGAFTGRMLGLASPIPGGSYLGGIAGAGLGAAGGNALADYLGYRTEEQFKEDVEGHSKEPGMEHHARGGVITRPTRTTLGENGPEVVIPLGGMGGGKQDESVQATKDLTVAIQRLLNQLRDKDVKGGSQYAYTPGAGETPTPASAQLFGGGTYGDSGSGGVSGGGGGGGAGGAGGSGNAGSNPMGSLPGLGGGGHASLGDRLNNPGNMKFGAFAKSLGATGAGPGGHAIFPDYATGRKAMEALLSKKGTGHSIAEIGKWYAEDPKWAAGVARSMGVSPDWKLNDEKDTSRLADAIQHQEGTTVGGYKEAQGGQGSGPPPAILAEAKKVALLGGGPAVKAYMASKGFPNHGEAWCGEFAAAVVTSAGGRPPANPAIASNWRHWGHHVDSPQPGDIAVARRGRTGSPGSHVTIVENAGQGSFTGIGGNQRGGRHSHFPTGGYDFYRGDAPEGSATAAAGTHQHQSMLENHRNMRAEMERPIKMSIHTPDTVGRRQRMQRIQSRMYAEDMIGTPRYAANMDIGFA